MAVARAMCAQASSRSLSGRTRHIPGCTCQSWLRQAKAGSLEETEQGQEEVSHWSLFPSNKNKNSRVIYQWRDKTCCHSSVCCDMCHMTWLSHCRCVNLSFIFPSTHLIVNGESKKEKWLQWLTGTDFYRSLNLLCVFFF